jgi:hypothetical protein
MDGWWRSSRIVSGGVDGAERPSCVWLRSTPQSPVFLRVQILDHLPTVGRLPSGNRPDMLAENERLAL